MQQQNSEIYDQLFDTLENLCGSKEDALWVHRLYRSSIKKPEFALTVPEPDQDMCDNISSDHAVQYKDCDVIPNLYNSLDPNLTFNEIVYWLGKSAKVINMIMFFEGLWTWMWFNKDVQVECTETFIAEVFKIKRKMNWRGIYSGLLDFEQISVTSKNFFDKIKECKAFCCESARIGFICCGLYMDSPDGSKDHSYNIDNIFTPQSMLRFKYKSSGMRIKECTNRDDCGIIIKTIKPKIA